MKRILLSLILLLFLKIYSSQNCTIQQVSERKCFIKCTCTNVFDLNHVNNDATCHYFTIYIKQNTISQNIVLNRQFFRGKTDKYVDKMILSRFCFDDINEDFMDNIMYNKTDRLVRFWQLTIKNSKCLKIVKNQIFRKLIFLRVLDLSFNQINQLNEKSFDGLEMLEILKLNNNFIVNVTIGFAAMKSLKTLDLSYNEIERLSEHVFNDISELEYLKLSHNFLRLLPNGIFSKIISIQTLDLSYNELQVFSSKLFGRNLRKNLRHLYLNNNQLKTIADQIIDFAGINPTHANIILSDNLWVCDENIAWMKRRKSFINQNSIRCAAPPNFEDMILHEIRLNDLVNNKPRAVVSKSDEYSFKAEIIGIVISTVFIISILCLIFYGYKYQWCTKNRHNINNNISLAKYIKTQNTLDEILEADEKCIIEQIG